MTSKQTDDGVLLCPDETIVEPEVDKPVVLKEDNAIEKIYPFTEKQSKGGQSEFRTIVNARREACQPDEPLVTPALREIFMESVGMTLEEYATRRLIYEITKRRDKNRGKKRSQHLPSSPLCSVLEK